MGSFYAVQVLSNLLVMAASYAYSCDADEFEHIFVFVYLGLSIVITNVLCHRYLLEKARVMCMLGVLVSQGKSREKVPM